MEPVTTDQLVSLEFTWPAHPLSMNDGDTWQTRNRAREWRERAYYAWIEAHPGKGPSDRPMWPCTVRTLIVFPDHRRRDPINYARTVKHIVDGFVQAGMAPDDTLPYVDQAIPVLATERPGRYVHITIDHALA